jgi:uncharacterized protein YaiL (DUF2058 family)
MAVTWLPLYEAQTLATDLFGSGSMAKTKRKTRKSKSRTATKRRASSKASRTRKVSRPKKVSRPRKASRTRRASPTTSRRGGFEAKSPGRSTANNELIDRPDKIYR